MGHWMHFGGQQMMVFAFLGAFLLLSPSSSDKNQDRSTACSPVSRWEYRDYPFWWILLAFVVVSIILNFTRGVWLGCFFATVYFVYRWRPKVLLAFPVILALGYLGAPGLIRERLHLAMHPKNEPALSIRLEMWGVAARMIRAHPWAGVGPNNIEEVYDLYLPPHTTPEVGYHNHFHNDYLQMAAERGLPCLAAWIWLMGALGWGIWKIRPRLTRQRWIADAALAALMAFLLEGFFEFNFGTSPVLMAFLFVTSTPFIAAKFAASSAGPEGSGVR
jgi:O-antigen ligase